MAEQLIKLPFTQEEYASRVRKVREQMDERGIDLMLFTTPENYFYLTGFQTGAHHSFIVLALPLSGEAAWIVRKTELSNVRSHTPVSWVKRGFGVDDTKDNIEVLASALREMGYERKRIGVEQDSLWFRVSHFFGLQRELPDGQLRDGSNMVESLRPVKSPAELEYMRQAGKITAKAVQAGIDALREGMTDSELASVLMATATKEGSEKMSGGPEVVVGKRSALAHSSWIGAPIRRGELVNTEMAAAVAHYNTPVYRISIIGEPSDEQRSFHDASLAGLEAGLSSFKPGMTSAEGDRIVRSAIEKAGYADYFPVRAAYSIGLGFTPGWSENHVMMIRPDDSRVLEPGMCFHVVPALYKEGLGCVCCSMSIEITKDGCASLVPMEPKLYVR